MILLKKYNIHNKFYDHIIKLQKEGKGEVQVLQWKGNTIGEYQGPGLIGPILEKFRRNLFDLDQINRLLEKAGPVKCLNLYRGMSNRCP